MISEPIIRTPHGHKPVHIDFASSGDENRLEGWHVPESRHIDQSAHDAVEFAHLAGKRWRYYVLRNEAATAVDDIVARIAERPTAEIGFLLVVRPTWVDSPADVLAVAWCRRTWCHHLVLDFLAVHPAANKSLGYGGVGTALLNGIALLTLTLSIDLIWGEATAESALFYQGLFGRFLDDNQKELEQTNVKDHFFIRGALLTKLQQEGQTYAFKKSQLP